ncbi:transposase [Microbacterium sp. SLBN-146]|uniref:transposase n=1 Tax=Microbacterium sp. SLBN-146 TaxID=2768457 RepID=UPI001359FA51|nr:transposase [Microbacterium sp. SLBN-146]
MLGVDEHVWRHTTFGAAIVDLTPIREKTSPSRLLDMVEGRSKGCSRPGSSSVPQASRDAPEVVAMDGFGLETATAEELPDTVTVIDPFHAVRLVSDALDECRVQRDTFGRRAGKTTPATTPDAPSTPAEACSRETAGSAEALFADKEYGEVEATWGIYQRMMDRLPATRPELGSSSCSP